MSDFSINCNPAFTEEPEERTQCDCCGDTAVTVTEYPNGISLCKSCVITKRNEIRSAMRSALWSMIGELDEYQTAVLLDPADDFTADVLDRVLDELREENT